MKMGREESPSVLNLIAERRRAVARAMLYILFPSVPQASACMPWKPEGAFHAAGLIRAYPSWRSCTCLGYSLAILKASEINFNANITHFDKVTYIYIYLHRHIILYFIKICTLYLLFHFLRNIWLNYILGVGNVWWLNYRISLPEMWGHTAQLCSDFHFGLQAIFVGVCAIQKRTWFP